MDIGNLPVYTKPTNNTRDSNSTTKKDAWDRIGDYEEAPAPASDTKDDDEEDNKEQIILQKKKETPSEKEKQESDDAASIASQLAVKESRKHQSTC